jgi:hypothetical protein
VANPLSMGVRASGAVAGVWHANVKHFRCSVSELALRRQREVLDSLPHDSVICLEVSFDETEIKVQVRRKSSSDRTRLSTATRSFMMVHGTLQCQNQVLGEMRRHSATPWGIFKIQAATPPLPIALPPQ